MLSLETLDLLLAIGEAELLEELVIGLLAAPQLAMFFNKYPRIKKALSRDFPAWKSRLKQRIHDAQVPPALAKEFSLYQCTLLEENPVFYAHLPGIVTQLDSLQSPFSAQAHLLLDSADHPQPGDSLQTLFLQRWRLSLTLQTMMLHQHLLEQEREQLLAELQQRLQISGALESLLVDNDHAAGRLWDMSKSDLRHGGHQTLLDYADVLQQQPELQKLAEQLGRSQTAKAIPQEQAKMESFTVMVREPAIMPEEVSGIHQSNDVLRLLPSEVAMLGITELEYEFYRRLLERRLLTYRLQGDSWREMQVQRPVTYQQNDRQPRGPFIICVDTSGSMGGFNEQCAKAFCLAMLRIALADNRRCYIMLFATEVIHYELTASSGLEQATRFLGQRFRGGTDLAACLVSTMKKMEESAWHDADAVIISDFIAQRLPDEVIQKIKRQQQHQQHRFHAVAMSDHGKPGIMRIFDHIWRFDTGLKSRLLRRWRR